MRGVFVWLIAALLIAFPGRAATLQDFNPWLWSYTTPSFDLNVDAVMNGGADFDSWRADWEPVWNAMVNNVPISVPDPAVAKTPVQKNGYTLQQIDFPFPSGPTIPTLLAIPTVVDPKKPVIIAIHGHEIAARGTVPVDMFATGYWPERWAQAGYIVWAPSHLWYTQLSPLYMQGHSYHVVWVRMLSRLLDASMPFFPAHSGIVASGLSSGAVSASFLMAYRPDIDEGVFAGSLIGLTYLRENYRIQGHPNQWDVKQIYDYAAIYALIAPRSVQWQMGRQDTFFPKTTPVWPSGTAFPGLPRPVSVQDFMGEWLLLDRIWANEGGVAKLFIHPNGHVFDFDAARQFLEENQP